MEMNKKDLKKMMYSFNTISSRMMRVKWDEYNMVLKKFINFIDNNEIIGDYINSGYDSNFDAEKEYNQVTTSYGDIKFNFGPTTEMESYQIYKILKHILEIDSKIHLAMIEQYNVKNFQERIKEFNDRVLLVLITNIEEYLTKVGIDMGLDENMMFNVSGGQVNISQGNSTLNATQYNSNDFSEIDKLIREIKLDLSKLSPKDEEEAIDAIDMIRSEIENQQPKKGNIRIGIKTLAPIITVANGIPVLISNLQKFIDMATTFIN